MVSSSPAGQGESPSRRTPWGPGSILGGRYSLVSKIGRGAMGEVWVADHQGLGSRIALKLVDTAARGEETETLARFHREARAAAALKSRHVVSILDHGSEGSIAFIAMELLDGESLEQRLARRRTLPPPEVATLLWEISRAMDKAHAAGIIHRDLKPSNVFIAREDGREVVKILDFGIAKMTSLPRELHVETQDGTVVGTPAYMSPEQVLGKTLDHRSDLWAMAILAFECLTGARPFDGESLGDLFVKICQAPMPVPSKIAPVPIGFDGWFAHAARRNPNDRFATAGDLAQSLTAVLAPEKLFEISLVTSRGSPMQALVKGTAPMPGAWSKPEMPARRLPPARAIAAIVGVAVIGAVAVFLVIGRSSHPPPLAPGVDSAAPPIAETPAPPPAVASALPTATIALPAPSASARAASPGGAPKQKSKRPEDEDLGF